MDQSGSGGDTENYLGSEIKKIGESCFQQALGRPGDDSSWVSTPVFRSQWNSVTLLGSLFCPASNWPLLPRTFCFLTHSVHLDLFTILPTAHTLFFFFLACVLVQISDWSSLLLWARPHRCLARHWSSGPLHQLNGHVKVSRVTWKNMATCFIEAVDGEVSHRRTERQGKHSGSYTQGEFHNKSKFPMTPSFHPHNNIARYA